MDIKPDSSGTLQVLINSEYLDWYRLVNGNLSGIGPLIGNGAFDTTSSDAPRLCYRDFPANRLLYARSNGTDYWTETVIDWDIGSQGNCSIAIPDPSRGIQVVGLSTPRIAYFDDGSDAIKYATPPLLSSQPWTIETVAPATGARAIDLYVDQLGKPTIIYFDSTSLKLRLAKLAVERSVELGDLLMVSTSNGQNEGHSWLRTMKARLLSPAQMITSLSVCVDVALDSGKDRVAEAPPDGPQSRAAVNKNRTRHQNAAVACLSPGSVEEHPFNCS